MRVFKHSLWRFMMKYYDKDGFQLVDGMHIKNQSGVIEKVILQCGNLGIRKGVMNLKPLSELDLKEWQIVKSGLPQEERYFHLQEMIRKIEKQVIEIEEILGGYKTKQANILLIHLQRSLKGLYKELEF